MRKKTLQVIGLVAAIAGAAVTMYTVFDGVDTSRNIQNTGWILMLAGVGITLYSRKVTS